MTIMSTSETPRTDANKWTPEWNGLGADPEPVVDADFARQLKRELKELQARFDERTAAYEKKDAEQFLLIGQLRYSAEMWKRQLKEAVEMLRGFEYVEEYFDGPICQFCRTKQNEGHRDDCAIAAILKKHKATI